MKTNSMRNLKTVGIRKTKEGVHAQVKLHKLNQRFQTENLKIKHGTLLQKTKEKLKSSIVEEATRPSPQSSQTGKKIPPRYEGKLETIASHPDPSSLLDDSPCTKLNKTNPNRGIFSFPPAGVAKVTVDVSSLH